MNKVYQRIWSKIKERWILVDEKVSSKGGPSGIVGAITLAAFLSMSGQVSALDPGALPTGGKITAGSGSIATLGSQMTVKQSSQKMIANWDTFNIGASAGVRFNQPNSSATALNRIYDQNPSQILGSLSANGKIYLINPSGIVFGEGAQVNVGGLVASSLNMLDSDFLAGKYTFTNNGKAGSVINQGNITAADGGVVALLAPKVTNEGTITANSGSVILGAGNQVSLDFTGDGLISYTLDKGAVDALASNKGLIKADGGMVVMTAKAADSLTGAVVNNSGIIEAQTLQDQGGRIMLMSDMVSGTTIVGGKLDASAPNGGDGGFIETSANKVKVNDGTVITTAAPLGITGTWLIDPVDFTIASGKTGTVTAGTPSGDISGATLSTALDTNNVTILSSQGSTADGDGDINVNDTVSWEANLLTLTAARDININANMIASGNSSLTMNTATGNGSDSGVAGGTVRVGMNTDGTFKGAVYFADDISGTNARSGEGFLTINGNGYTVISDIDDLQDMGTSGYYALGSNINASATSGWNYNGSFYEGFGPIGDSGTPFSGQFDGLGHTIGSLYINRPDNEYVGLFGYTSNAALRNVGIVNANITGGSYVGGLVGYNDPTNINNAYSTGSVTGTGGDDYDYYAYGEDVYVGGLVGYNDGGNITNSFSSAIVTGTGGNGFGNYGYGGAAYVGGLVGQNNGGEIGTSNATGAVTGTGGNGFGEDGTGGAVYVGGLVGQNSSSLYGTGNITGSNASGTVTGTAGNGYGEDGTGGAAYVGGLVGQNNGGEIVTSNATGTLVIGIGGYGYGEDDGIGGAAYVGGLVGQNSSSLYGTGNITGSNASGRVVGRTFSGFREFGSGFGEDDGTGGAVYVGGLVGQNNGGDINTSNATGDLVLGTGGDGYGWWGDGVGGAAYVGGLVGQNNSSFYGTGNITGSKAYGRVAGTGGYSDGWWSGIGGTVYVGGLVGQNNGTLIFGTGNITGSNAYGSVLGRGGNGAGYGHGYGEDGTGGNAFVGGLVGQNNNGAITTSNANGSAVAGYGGNGYGYFGVGGASYVGGLVGQNNGTLIFGTGNITGSNAYGSVLGMGGNSGEYDDVDNVVETFGGEDATGGAVYAGGLVGQNSGGAITTSNANGSAVAGYGGNGFGEDSGTGGDVYVGGLVGQNNDSLIFGTGNITGSNVYGSVLGVGGNGYGHWSDGTGGSVYAGGLIGQNNGGAITNFNANGSTVAGYGGDGIGYGGNGSSYWNDGWYDGYGEDGTGTGGAAYVGGLVGQNNSGAITTSNATSVLNVVGTGGNGFGTGGNGSGHESSGWWYSGGHGGKGIGTGGNVFVGGLVGQNNSSDITNSHGTNVVTGTGGNGTGTGGNGYGNYGWGGKGIGTGGNVFVGGLVGQNSGNITGSSETSAVTVTGIGGNGSGYGGNGYGYYNRYGSWSSGYGGDGSGTGGNAYAGGLVGQNNGAEITSSNAIGVVTVSGTGGNGIGTGGNGYGEDGGNYKNGRGMGGDGTGTGGAVYAGGLVGQNSGSIGAESYATGNVSGTGGNGIGTGGYGRGSSYYGAWGMGEDGSGTGGAVYAGGLVGQNSGSIGTESYATGNVTGTGGNGIGTGGYGRGNNGYYYSWSMGMGEDGSGTGGAVYAGGLVGQNNGSIGIESYATGNVTGTGGDGIGTGGSGYGEDGGYYNNGMGMGEDGWAYGGDVYAGGLVGQNNGSIGAESYAKGDVSGTGGNAIGTGGNGYGNGNSRSYIGTGMGEDGWAYGGDAYVGGLVGQNTSTGSIGAESYATGNVSGTGGNAIGTGGNGFGYWSWGGTGLGEDGGDVYVGGLVGQNNGSIGTGLYATGNVTGTGGDGIGTGGNAYGYQTWSGTGYGWWGGFAYVGGLVGQNNGADITNSYATGNVSGTGGKGYGYRGDSYGFNYRSWGWGMGWGGNVYVGGLVGQNINSNITASNATGATVTGIGGYGEDGGNAYVGGLVGEDSGGSIGTSYATGSVIGIGGEDGGNTYVGGLVGYNNSSNITASYATGAVSGEDYVGGLVGYNNSSNITASYATGAVSGEDYVGGLVGYNSSSDITTSHAIGAVSGEDDVGGLVGYNNGSDIITSYATGNVDGEGDVGGLVGLNNYGSSITESYAVGAVNGWEDVGGLVGHNDGSIFCSFANGNVDGEYDVGGLVGQNDGTIACSFCTGTVNGYYNIGGLVGYNYYGSITDAYSTGAVSGYGNIGGLIGYDYRGNTTNTYATGLVSGSNNVGGLIGYNDNGSISNSFWDVTTTGMPDWAGIGSGTPGVNIYGLDTDTMQTLSTFTTDYGANWDITANGGGTTEIWRIYEGDTYPLLRCFLTPVTVSAEDGSIVKIYDGTSDIGLSSIEYTLPPGETMDESKIYGTLITTGTNGGSTLPNVGVYSLIFSGLYSEQLGYDISYDNTGTLTINKAPVSFTGTRVFDGATGVAAEIFGTGGTITTGIGTESLVLTGSGTVGSPNVSAGLQNVNTTGLTLNNGTGLASNYTFGGGVQTASFTPASVSFTGARAYDGTTIFNATAFGTGGTIATGIGTESLTLTGSGSVGDPNVSAGSQNVDITGLTLNNGTGLAGNYTLTGGIHTASVTPLALVGNFTAANRIWFFWDTSATITSRTLTGAVVGEDVSYTGGTATFADGNAGMGKLVIGTGFVLSGADAGNYTVNTTAYTTADMSADPYIYGALIGIASGAGGGVAGYYLAPYILPLLANLTPEQIQDLIDTPWQEGLIPPSFTLTSYLTPPVIEGISVDILRMSDGNKPGQEGIIMVNIPYELTLPGSSLSFRLPQSIAGEIEDNNYPVTVTLADGSPLPAWLQYNPDSQTFTAINIPEGYLPVSVLINYGGKSWRLEIKEQV